MENEKLETSAASPLQKLVMPHDCDGGRHPSGAVYRYEKVRIEHGKIPNVFGVIINCCLRCGVEWDAA